MRVFAVRAFVCVCVMRMCWCDGLVSEVLIEGAGICGKEGTTILTVGAVTFGSVNAAPFSLFMRVV